ncbi:SdiA-regulated domain-containing protein [Caldithrix abyssi]|nr:SdiA-regulated domain-containing protein [Caldithrix abyssi]
MAMFLACGSVFLIQCSLTEPEDTTPPVRSLTLVNSYALDVAEPSGLALTPDGSALWTVSDHSNRIVQISLTGKRLKTLSYQGNDLEGVVIDPTAHTLWVAEERSRELVEVDSTGKELQRHRILDGDDNSGLEGVCFDVLRRLFTIKEKQPGLLMALNADFSIRWQKELSFAGDYSGLCADTLLNRFWILSDQDESLFLWDTNAGLVGQYKLNIVGPEGIAIDFARGLIYVVSDPQSRLYVFKLEKSF